MGVDEEIFARYSQAYARQIDPDNIALADSLYAVGCERNDPKIKMLALQLELLPQFVSGNEERVKAIADETEAIGLQYPETQEVYFFVHLNIVHLLSCYEDIVQSTTYARRLFANSKNTSKRSQFLAYRALAEVYSARKDFISEYDCLQRALDLCEEEGVDGGIESRVSFLLTVGENFVNLHRFDEAFEMEARAENLIESCSPATQGMLKYMTGIMRFMTCYEAKMYPEAVTAFEKILSMDCLPAFESPDRIDAYMAKYFLCRREFNNALAALKRCGIPELQDEIGERIYAESGDFANAYAAASRISERTDSLLFLANSADEAFFEKELEVGVLRAENAEIKLRHQKVTSYLILALAVLAVAFLASIAISFHKKVKFMAEVADNRKKYVDAITKRARGPLTRILTNSDVLRNSYGELSEADRDAHGDEIIRDCSRLLLLLDDIVYSSTDPGNEEIFSLSCSFGLDEICQDVMDDIANEVHDNLELKYVSGVGPDFEIKTDPKRFSNIVNHMLGRACNKTEEGTVTLESSLSEREGCLCISVADMGAPVDFKRVDRALKFGKERLIKYDSDLGIGLSLCRSLASQLGGEFYRDPSYTQGSRFVFCFPLKNENSLRENKIERR